MPEFSDAETPTYEAIQERINPLLKAIFSDSWKAQLTRYKETEVSRALDKKAKGMLTETSGD